MADLLERLRELFAGTFDVEGELARGGMSRLFLARDPVLGRKVVIKILPPEFANETTAARFRREAELTALLQHPHILPVISAGVSGDVMYYVTPYVSGESLRGKMAREGALAPREASRLLYEIADALAFAHSQGIVHRDVKPENVLLQGGHAVVADFGIASALHSSASERLTFTGMSLGTVGYMAPEQAAGERDIDARADVYALGVVGYEMFAGRPPFIARGNQALIAAHLTEKPAPLERFAPDVPTGVALAIDRALAKHPDARFDDAAGFRNALRASTPAMAAMARTVPLRLATLPSRSTLRRTGWVAAAALIAAGGAAAWSRHERTRAVPSDVVTVAVAPFAILGDDPSLTLWHEGMVDVLARNLDGAGSLRTISPSLVLKRPSPVNSANDAVALAKETHASYAVWGRITPTAGDSIRLYAQLINPSDSVALTYERVDASVEHLADSLTVRVLAELARRHRIGAVQRPLPLSAKSLPALHAFLEGERYYRRTAFDSALVMYNRSIAADSSFALPVYRVAWIQSWKVSLADRLTRATFLRAGSLNHGLGARDSLVIVADSITAALSEPDAPALDWALLRRLFSTLADASRRYPDDAEVWYDLGEARQHFGYGRELGVTDASTLAAFDRSIALDSSFAPAYVHCVDLALMTRGTSDAKRYAEKFLSLGTQTTEANGIALVDRLIDPARSSTSETRRLIDTVSLDALRQAIFSTLRWPDTAETALSLLRALDRRSHNAPSLKADSTLAALLIPLELAYRGRFREAYAALGDKPSRLIPEIAIIGGLPRDTIQRIVGAWLARGVPTARWAAPWWASQGDTAALVSLGRYADSTLHSGSAEAVQTAKYLRQSLGAYLALARRDTAAAMQAFINLPDTACVGCYTDRWIEARLRASRGENSVADTLVSLRPYTALTPIEIPMALDRARIAQAMHDSAAAASSYELVLAAWRGGDPVVSSYLEQARRGLQQLRGTTVARVTATP